MSSSLQGVSMQPATPSGRKPMRKGTHSCTQCRRRKRRCVFESGSSVCLPCSIRGSTCIDQREVSTGTSGQASEGPRASVRRAGGRTNKKAREDSSDSIQYSVLVSTTHTRSDEGDEDLELTAGVLPPIMSIMNDPQDTASSAIESMASSGPTALVSQRANTCRELRSAMPPYDEIIQTLTNNSDWWESFRQKTRAISQSEPCEPLLSFAARAYTSDSPAELGTLVIAYGRSLGRGTQLFGLVDRLVLADFTIAATIHGMECLILLGKTYTDVGQPRRAWLTWRRGLAHAQLMGLHRLSPNEDGVRQRIWLAVYHGDRFTSLLLGLPHGFNDAYLDMPKPQAALKDDNWLPDLIHRSIVVAGKVIDANISPGKRSFAKAMLLDEEMDAAYDTAPASWWNLPSDVPCTVAERDLLVTQLLIQFFFFHVRMYIHLPFMASSANDSRLGSMWNASQLACIEAGRQILRRYLVLRASTNDGKSLFDCKTTDFVGFTAAVVLLTERVDPDRSHTGHDADDLQLVMKTKAVMQLIEDRSGCHIASQCRKILALFLEPPQSGEPDEKTKITVPYFGTLVRRRQLVNCSTTESHEHRLHNADPGLQAELSNSGPLEQWYADLTIQDLTWGAWDVVDGNLGFSPSCDGLSFDLDQDWNSYL